MNHRIFTIPLYSLFVLVSITMIPAEAACTDPTAPSVDWSSCDFAGSDLSGSDLSRADLSSGDFSGANLSNVILVDADLSDADFSLADLTNADLTGADATGSDFSEANFSGTTTTGADFTGSDFTNAVGNVPGLPNVPKTGGGGSSNTTPPSFGKSWIDSDKQEPSIVIGEQEILIPRYQSEIISSEPIIHSVGEPLPISLILYDDGGPQGISHVGVFTDLRGDQGTNPSNSDTWVEWDGNDSDVIINNKNEMLSNVKVNSEIIDNLLHIDFELTFDKPMEKSNVILYIWDYNRNAIQMKLLDILEIVELEKQIIPQHKSDEIISEQIIPVDQQTMIKRWAGFDSVSATDSELIKALNLDETENKIPNWFKSYVAKWFVQDKINYEDFVNAAKYLVS